MSGTNSLIVNKSVLAGASQSAIAERLLNANEEAIKLDKKDDKKSEPKKK